MRIAIFALALLLAGCTPSLEPLYTKQDVVFDPALLGIWREADGTDYFVATRLEHGEYRILQTDGGGTGSFTARLVKLGDSRFVDLHPDKPLVPNGFYGGHLVRCHSFGQLWLDGDKLRIGLLDPDWFKTEQASAAVLPRIVLNKDLLITAPTAQLREFAMKFANTNAFAAESSWVRQR